MAEHVYIVIPDFGDMVHADTTKRGRTPIWVKTFTQLLSRDEYLELSGHRRAILHGLILEYARSGCRVRLDAPSTSRRLNLRVTMKDLEAIKNLGFIEFRQDSVKTPSSLEGKRREKNTPSVGSPSAWPPTPEDVVKAFSRRYGNRRTSFGGDVFADWEIEQIGMLQLAYERANKLLEQQAA